LSQYQCCCLTSTSAHHMHRFNCKVVPEERIPTRQRSYIARAYWVIAPASTCAERYLVYCCCIYRMASTLFTHNPQMKAIVHFLLAVQFSKTSRRPRVNTGIDSLWLLMGLMRMFSAGKTSTRVCFWRQFPNDKFAPCAWAAHSNPSLF
jgi:hypothetical protein